MNTMKLSMTFLIGISLMFSGWAESTVDHVEVDQGTRNTAALKKLQSEQDIVSAYAKGLCCASCAIGVRIKVSKLKFVDKTRFNKGVELDTLNQLVTVALRKDQPFDRKKLARAIDAAGYLPFHLYTVENGKLKTEPLSVK